MFTNAYGDGIDHTPADDAAGNHWYDNDYDDSAWGDIVGSLDASDGTWKAGEKGMYYIRRHFTIDDLTKTYNMPLRMYDYGVLYINGRQFSSESYWGSTYGISSDWLQEGDNVIAVYVEDHNGGDMFLDFGIYEEVQSFTIGDLEYEFNTPNSVKLNRATNNNITQLVIPDSIEYNGKQFPVTSIGDYAFSDYRKLNYVKIGEEVEIIDKYAFRGCNNLPSIIIPNKVRKIGSCAFESCGRLSNISFGEGLETIGYNAFWNCGLLSVDLKNVRIVGADAFAHCYGIRKLTLGKSIEFIGNRAFFNCYRISYVTIPASVSTIGDEAFRNDNSNATPILFQCEGNIPASITGYPFESDATFLVPEASADTYKTEWSNYKEQIISDANWRQEVTIAQNPNLSALHRAIGEEKLIYTGDLKISGTMNSYDLMIIRNKMPNLRHLDLSDCRIVANPYEFYTGYCTQNDTIPTYAFYQMNNLLTLKLPKVLKHIGYSAFSECYNLQQITMPEQLESLGNYCFNTCQSLDSITIPEGVKVLPSYAFLGCTDLTDVKLPNTLESIGRYCFSGCIYEA